MHISSLNGPSRPRGVAGEVGVAHQKGLDEIARIGYV